MSPHRARTLYVNESSVWYDEHNQRNEDKVTPREYSPVDLHKALLTLGENLDLLFECIGVKTLTVCLRLSF